MKEESHQFYCVECGKKGIPVARSKSSQREKGHLKKLWCLNCKKETNHAEISKNYPVEIFLYEYNNHNFINGNRINSADSMIKKYYKEN